MDRIVVQNIALVPALFVPGSVEDALVITRAAMWDVRNEFLYFTAESESTKKDTSPAAFTDSRKLTAEAKDEAIGQRRVDLVGAIRRLFSATFPSMHQWIEMVTTYCFCVPWFPVN